MDGDNGGGDRMAPPEISADVNFAFCKILFFKPVPFSLFKFSSAASAEDVEASGGSNKVEGTDGEGVSGAGT